MKKLHESTVSKMSSIQPVKYRTWDMGLFKMPCFETPRFQTEVFKAEIRVASGLRLPDKLSTKLLSQVVNKCNSK